MSVTEQENPAFSSLHTQTSLEILRVINREDQKVALAVARVIPQIAKAVELIVPALAEGGRLVYLGTGTSGRLGVLDAAECIPTFGTDQVIGILAGAPRAMFRPAEGVEDDCRLAVRDLRRIKLARRDVLMAISASGRTPYTVEGLRFASSLGTKTIALTSNPDAPMNRLAEVAIVPAPGPEVIAGSTRMKAGTAQKLVLNMISTASMVRLGKVLSNWMIDVQSNNEKLRQRAARILMEAAGVSAAQASEALREAGGRLPIALLMLIKGISKHQAARLLGGRTDIAVVLSQAQAEAKTGGRATRR